MVTPGAMCRADLRHRLGGEPAGDPHALDRVGVLDLRAGVARRAAGVRRTRGARWLRHGAEGRDAARESARAWCRSLDRGKDAAMSDEDDQWWFCLKHNEVEQGTGCANSERMGPYATREEATRGDQRTPPSAPSSGTRTRAGTTTDPPRGSMTKGPHPGSGAAPSACRGAWSALLARLWRLAAPFLPAVLRLRSSSPGWQRPSWPAALRAVASCGRGSRPPSWRSSCALSSWRWSCAAVFFAAVLRVRLLRRRFFAASSSRVLFARVARLLGGGLARGRLLGRSLAGGGLPGGFLRGLLARSSCAVDFFAVFLAGDFLAAFFAVRAACRLT